MCLPLRTFIPYCRLVTESCPILCHPMDCSLPGSSVHGILQVRILECIAISSSRGSSQPRDRTWVFCIDRQILYHLSHLWSLFIPEQVFLFLYHGVSGPRRGSTVLWELSQSRVAVFHCSHLSFFTNQCAQPLWGRNERSFHHACPLQDPSTWNWAGFIWDSHNHWLSERVSKCRNLVTEVRTGDFLAVQWVALCASTAGGTSSSPGRSAKILHVVMPKTNKTCANHPPPKQKRTNHTRKQEHSPGRFQSALRCQPLTVAPGLLTVELTRRDWWGGLSDRFPPLECFSSCSECVYPCDFGRWMRRVVISMKRQRGHSVPISAHLCFSFFKTSSWTGCS